MRKNTFFGITALGIAGIFLVAPVANADQVKGSLGFIDSPAKPGESVQLIGGCTAPGFTTAKLQSTVLEPAEVYLKDTGAGMGLNGFTNVKKDAKPGTYPVSFQCGNVRVTAKFTVEGEKKAQPKPKPTTGKPVPPKATEAQVEVKPKGAADTGEGDAVAAPQQQSGPGAGVYALGGGVLAAMAGAGVFAFRRLKKEV